MDQSIDILSYVKALTRRVWTILLTLVLGSVLAAGVAYVLPPVYESTAKILVESQQIPEDLAQATVRQSVAERLDLIEQRLLTRDNLLRLIDELGLFADRPDLTPSEKVERIRNATRFENFSYHDSNPRYRGPTLVSAFTISYSTNSAPLAAKVANEFVTLVLEQNIAARSERASETYDFFKQEVERLAGELLDLETQVARYKNENAGALPDSYEFRLSELLALEQRRFDLEQRRAQIESQRRTLQAGTGMLPGVQLSPEERQLAELRRTLTEKRSMLADSHPQIVALQASISALESSIGQHQTSASPDNVASTAQLTRRPAEIEAQLALMDHELKLIAQQQSSSETRIEELRESLAKTPNIELALKAYDRRYANLQSQYDNTVQKLAEADTGKRLEVNRQAERFEILEQAQVPTDPVAPNRLLIASGGAAGSLMLGLGLALAFEMANPAIRTSADLQRRLQLRPVIAVPYIRTRGERRRLALKWTVRIVLLVGGLALLLWAVDQYVKPLQVLWENALERSGFEDFMHVVRMRLT